MKKLFIICSLVVIGVVCIGVFISGNIMSTNSRENAGVPSQPVELPKIISGDKIAVFSSLIGTITIDIPIPESPSTIRVYKGYFQEGDLIKKRFRSTTDVNNPISADQAPVFAEAILEQYGGLPSDAILQYSFINYANLIDRQTGDFVDRIPQETFVSWYRTINGMDILGDSDTIQVELGENGELNRIYKCWRTYIPLGNVSIISASKAIEKLRIGDVINPTSDIFHQDVKIYNMHLSYYIPGVDEPEITLEPIWVFYGETTSGECLPFYVYARQFTDFTSTPTYGTAPLTVAFTDISDASPINWNWDFGDGKTSEEQNPVHTYTTAGAYTVTLKATNYLGSDTMTKTSYILIGKMAIVMQIGSKLDELIAVVNTMQFDNGIKKSLMQKLENAKAKNDDAMNFISQNKEKQANNMLNAEDNQMRAFTNRLDAQTGKGISTDDAAKLTSIVVEIQGLIQEAIETPL